MSACAYAARQVPHGPHDVWPLVVDPFTEGVFHVGLGSVPCAGYRGPMTETTPDPQPEPTEVPVEVPAKEETTVEVDPAVAEGKAPEPFGYETKENPAT